MAHSFIKKTDSVFAAPDCCRVEDSVANRNFLDVSQGSKSCTLKLRDRLRCCAGFYGNSHDILAQQIDGNTEENEILQEKRHALRHRGKSSRGGSPAVRHERNNGDGGDEGKAGTQGSQNSQFLVPESGE